MKKFLLLPLATLCVLSVQARQLTPREALSRALGSESVIPSRSGDLDLTYTATAQASQQPGVYVFNRADNAGFVMVSADDAATALLGYADQGTFDAASIPPALQAWLDEYADQVAWAARHNASTPTTLSRAASFERPERAPIAPMCHTKWDQSTPYNDLCPTMQVYYYDENYQIATKDTICVTGCVATSGAQVMKFHNWPKRGTGFVNYSWRAQDLTMDFAETTFDWANMLDSYTGDYTEAQAEAVATLMKACGYAAHMNYSYDESGATTWNQLEGFIKYFNYDKGATFNNRSWYGLLDWENIIYNSLEKDGPVILGGQSRSGGHSFVCDGYSSDGYFHINWGWSGMSDGYFRLTALDPESQGIGGSDSGYNFNQDAITGISKPKTNSAYTYQFAADSLSCSVTGSKKGIEIHGNVWNYSTCTLTNVTFGAEIDGKFYASSTRSNSLPPQAGHKNITYNVTLTSLSAGTYRVRPAFKCDECDWTVMKTNISLNPYITVTIDKSHNVTIENSDVKLAAKDVKLLTPMMCYNAFQLSATITNSGATEYADPLVAVLRDSKGQIYDLSEYAIDLLPGDTETILFEGTVDGKDIPAGNYTLYIGRSIDNGTIQIISEPLSVNIQEFIAPSLSVNDITISNSHAVILDDIDISLSISNYGGYFGGTIDVVIFPNVSGQVYSLGSITTPFISLPANTYNHSVSFKGRFPEGEVGKSYFVNVFYTYFDPAYDSNIRKNIGGFASFTVAALTGINEIGTDIDGSNTQVYNISGVKVAEGSAAYDTLPSGLYIVVTTDSKGNRTTTKVAKP